MSTTESALWFMGVLLVLLLIGVYFVGFATDATAFAKSLVSVIYAVTGRTTSGSFAGYPSGATLNPSVLK